MQYAGADLSGYSNNSFFGKDAGRMYLSGDDNSFFGVSSGYRNSGNSNAFFGSNTGDDHITGSYNTFIGANSGDSGYENHSIAIGYNAKVKCDNCAVIGGTAMADMVRVGIGVDSPTVLLHLLAPNAVAPVGITQNLVGSGGSSTMELTTQDGSQKQASRLVFRGNNDFPDIEFYRGGRGSEQITMFIEGGNGNVGINNQVPSEKLDVNGKARIRTIGSAASIGALHYTASGVLTTSTSDRRLKENIHTLESPLEKTLALRGVNYSWKNDSTHTKRLGLIAQEVEEIVPEVVFTNEVDGYKGIHYQELPALLIEAIKEQQILIEGLQKELTELKQSLKKHPRLYSEK